MILVGMAGAGKSSVGRLLASTLNYPFIDTDDLITGRTGLPIQEVLQRHGPKGFRLLEEQALLSLRPGKLVIATGGSAIYSQAGMEHLHSMGTIIHLRVTLQELEKRRLDLKNRGLLNPGGLSFAQLYVERMPLYSRHADHELDCSSMGTDKTVKALLLYLKKME